MYLEDIKKGDDYKELSKVITINILDFEFTQLDKYHTSYHLWEDEVKDYKLTELVEIHFIELPKFRKLIHKNYREDALQRWMMFLEKDVSEEVLREILIIKIKRERMLEEMQLFHGSGLVVDKPRVLISGFYKDFGYGFYCTNMEKQAKRWALTRKLNHVVNRYRYVPNKQLRVLHYEEMTDNWLDFVVACRSGMNHDYDIVDGPMADDTIWDYIEDYIDGAISREAFWVLVKFKYPTHQIVFCNDKALETLQFEGSYQL